MRNDVRNGFPGSNFLSWALILGVILFSASMAWGQVGPPRSPISEKEPTQEEAALLWRLNLIRRFSSEAGSDLQLNNTRFPWDERLQSMPPLAPSRKLTASSRYHAEDMIHRGYFGHANPSPMTSPPSDWRNQNDLVRYAGYSLHERYAEAGNGVESLADLYWPSSWRPTELYASMSMLLGLLADEDPSYVSSHPGHREHLLGQYMGVDPETDKCYLNQQALNREAGVGIASGVVGAEDRKVVSIHMAYQHDGGQEAYNNGSPYLLGVVYEDRNRNRCFDPGEGVAGVEISILVKRISLSSTTTDSTGFWSYRADNPPYSFQVQAQGVTTLVNLVREPMDIWYRDSGENYRKVSDATIFRNSEIDFRRDGTDWHSEVDFGDSERVLTAIEEPDPITSGGNGHNGSDGSGGDSRSSSGGGGGGGCNSGFGGAITRGNALPLLLTLLPLLLLRLRRR